MRCTVCKKDSEEVSLYQGIMDTGLVLICHSCAEIEGVPLIKKPTNEQIKDVDSRPSVRQRMERLSGYRDRTEISHEQLNVQGNLAKLKNPYKNEMNSEVVENYYWEINMARRRKKMTINQLANLSQIPIKDLEAVEKGVLPNNFREVFLKLESILGLKLLKNHDQELNFKRDVDYEKRILEEVRAKMGKKEKQEGYSSGDEDVVILKKEKRGLNNDDEEYEERKTKHEKIKRISRGEVDFSRRDNIQDVTLNDLVTMKRQKEKAEEKRRAKMKEEAMIGEDLDIDDIDLDDI